MARKSIRGRKKTRHKRVENERQRAVTLSKRHNGVFKKASELATLCGAQIAIILFTIGGKPLSFGSPDVFSIVDKFLSLIRADYNPHDFRRRFANSFNESKLQVLNHVFNKLNEKLKIEKKKGEILEGIPKLILGGKTYEEIISSNDIDELMKLKFKLEELKRNLECGHRSTTSGPASSNHEYQVDLSKVKGPNDYLKL